MSKRRNKNTVPDTKDKRIAELEQQLAQALVIIQRQQKQLEHLQQVSTQLQAEVEELKRAGKRQATPFARRHWVEHPRRPGRKAGQGRFVYRAKPSLQEVQETKTAPLPVCPACGGKVRARRKHEQYMIDLPQVQPVITRFVTYSGYCGHCHKRMHSWHPDQVSQAGGAAGVMVGPRARALAVDLKHRLGASYAKVSETLNDAFGLRVSRSGWCQADQKLARTAEPIYAELLEQVRHCNVVHADETGWRMGTLAAWLWVFTNRQATVYAIRDNRSSQVVIDVLGCEFPGILVSDCFVAYDDRRLSTWLKQKCLSHLLSELQEMQENKTGRALHFARQLSLLLQQALALKATKPNLDPLTFSQQAHALEIRLDQLIAPQRRFRDRHNARFAKRLRRQRPHLLRFLYVDALDPTNNQAERMLRPAVITRKTNGCNRTRSGAMDHAILASVLATCHQQAIPILDYLVPLQLLGQAPPILGFPNSVLPPPSLPTRR
jgi:hypothetical protein